MSIRDFAAHTNLSTYAIRDFEAKGEHANLRISTQRILDDAFAGAPEDGKLRFTAALHATPADDAGALGQTVTAPRQLPRPRQRPEARVVATADGPVEEKPTDSNGHCSQSSTTASGQTDVVEDDAKRRRDRLASSGVAVTVAMLLSPAIEAVSAVAKGLASNETSTHADQPIEYSTMAQAAAQVKRSYQAGDHHGCLPSSLAYWPPLGLRQTDASAARDSGWRPTSTRPPAAC